MSVTSELPPVVRPARRRASAAAVIPFPRARSGCGGAPAGVGSGRPAPLGSGSRRRSEVEASRSGAAPVRASGAAGAELRGPEPAPAGAAEVAGRPELSVIEGAGAARPLRVVEATPTRPTLVPELAQPPAGPGVVTAGLPGRRAAAVGRQRSAPARAAGSRPARLTRRGRLVLATLATFAVAGVLMALGPTVAHLGPAAAVPANAPAVVVVQPGDTLWSIARRVAPDRDARLVVADLRRLNSLPTADLEVGQRLQVGRG